MYTNKFNIFIKIILIESIVLSFIYSNTLEEKALKKVEVNGKIMTFFKSSINNDNRDSFNNKWTNIEINPLTNVVLEGTKSYKAFPNKEGEFKFYDVYEGLYVIYVNDYNYEYDSFIIEVTFDDASSDNVKVYQRSLKKGKGFKQKYPVKLFPISNNVYTEESSNVISSVIKSPYMIIIGMTVLMFMCMKLVPQDQLNEQFSQLNKQMNQFKKNQ